MRVRVQAGAAVDLRRVDELLPATEAALVKCLLLRASYGGMAGDVAMLRSFASLWAARFAGAAGGAVAVGPIT